MNACACIIVGVSFEGPFIKPRGSMKVSNILVDVVWGKRVSGLGIRARFKFKVSKVRDLWVY